MIKILNIINKILFVVLICIAIVDAVLKTDFFEAAYFTFLIAVLLSVIFMALKNETNYGNKMNAIIIVLAIIAIILSILSIAVPNVLIGYSGMKFFTNLIMCTLYIMIIYRKKEK